MRCNVNVPSSALADGQNILQVLSIVNQSRGKTPNESSGNKLDNIVLIFRLGLVDLIEQSRRRSYATLRTSESSLTCD